MGRGGGFQLPSSCFSTPPKNVDGSKDISLSIYKRRQPRARVDMMYLLSKEHNKHMKTQHETKPTPIQHKIPHWESFYVHVTPLIHLWTKHSALFLQLTNRKSVEHGCIDVVGRTAEVSMIPRGVSLIRAEQRQVVDDCVHQYITTHRHVEICLNKNVSQHERLNKRNKYIGLWYRSTYIGQYSITYICMYIYVVCSMYTYVVCSM